MPFYFSTKAFEENSVQQSQADYYLRTFQVSSRTPQAHDQMADLR